MQLSNTGRIIHFYFVSGRWLGMASIVLIVLLLLSLALILSVPEFALNQPHSKISSNRILAIGQVVVGIAFLGSFFGIIVLGIAVSFWFWPEIIYEVVLRKKTLRIIQTRRRIAISDLAGEVGVYESELGILLKHWVAARNRFHVDPTKGTFSGNHLKMDLANREVSWEE
jgi:hypothetical protein